MQFGYDTTNKNSIFDDIDSLCGSTSATYPTLSKRRNVLQAYHDTARLIWECDGTYAYDDSNREDEAKATRTISNASASYLIPTTAMEIKGVEIKNSAGNWTKLGPLNYHDLEQSPEEFLETAGTPLYYSVDGTQIRLYPPPGTGRVTMSSGLCLRISREVSAFASAATTSPGFPSAFHRILSYAASIDFEKDTQALDRLILMKDRLERGLVKFYSKRGAQMKTRIKPYLHRRNRQWL